MALNRYFAQLEEQIVDRFKANASQTSSRDELSVHTGIKDPVLLEEIIELGIPPEGLIAFRIYPLVMVAWASEGVDANEREAIRRVASRLGISSESVARILVDHWTRRPPPKLCMDAWKRYCRHLFSKMSHQSAQQLIDLTRTQMQEIAGASGGILGFNKTSNKEALRIKQMIDEMDRCLALNASK
ncbi:MAG: hypothetical protein AAF958_07710 [Planctomycetota bacterium]